jgi:hypothetical protein
MGASAMTDERFWSIIDSAQGGSSSASPDRLADILGPLAKDEVSDFGLLFYNKICLLNSWRLWGAGYVIAGGMSDDSFHYFRSWIIGKGKNVYEIALTDPDQLGPFIDDPEVENELLEYVAIEVLEKRGIKEDPRDRADRTADFEPAGTPFEEDTVASSFPKLAAQFG